MGIDKADWEKGSNLFKRKNGYVNVLFRMIYYWDVERLGMLLEIEMVVKELQELLRIGIDILVRCCNSQKQWYISSWD